MKTIKLDVIGLSKIWLGISAVFMLASIIVVAIFGLNMGIDFTGGSFMELSLENRPSVQDLRADIQEFGYEARVQDSGEREVVIRLQNISPEEHNQLIDQIKARYGAVEELRFESVGPVIGKELKEKSVLAVVLLLILIVIYVAWSFRKVSKPVVSWKYGVLTIVAAIHDVIIPIGLFALLGHYFGYQIDTAFVAALLTIIGYSINDTIVVFDRTRENLVTNRHSDVPFSEVVNKSIEQSFARSINTSLTTLLVLIAIFFFGGETTKPFVLALIVGIVSGTYSSIFIASPLLVLWEKLGKK